MPEPTKRKQTSQPTDAAVRLAQAEQRLAQERLVMQARLEKDRSTRRIQEAMGWLIVVMLPSVAVVCVVVMANYEHVPFSMVTSASGAFFVDIVGLVVAGWRTLLVRNLPDRPLEPVTEAPDMHDHHEGHPIPRQSTAEQIDVQQAEHRVVHLDDQPD